MARTRNNKIKKQMMKYDKIHILVVIVIKIKQTY